MDEMSDPTTLLAFNAGEDAARAAGIHGLKSSAHRFLGVLQVQTTRGSAGWA